MRKYLIGRSDRGFFVNQETNSGGTWNHSVQTGYHPTWDAAVAWAKAHAGDQPRVILAYPHHKEA
jgi:hypothetical protein